ncbi:MAG: response regulator transcription factor [Planctomycetes bacterium]|nr:response regulator transcription factor [Planctomycetota bacterium]
MSERVLIVEDDPDIAHLARLHLSGGGYEVTVAGDGEAGLAAFAAGADLVLLDIGLPDLDGLEVCRRLRRAAPRVPILLLTARGEESDRVLGLELGADDYLTKPVGYRELVARVRAHLRRVSVLADGAASEAERVEVGALEVDVARHRARWDGVELDLTAREFELLELFARRTGEVFTRGDLLTELWGTAFAGYEHTVNSHINRLRKKLVAAGAPRDLVETVWGVGYRLGAQA